MEQNQHEHKKHGCFGSETPSVETEVLECDGGRAILTHYAVFPGITLTYRDVHLQEYTAAPETGNIIAIDHCREGRMECASQERFFYLAPGDLSISRREGGDRTFFPLSHYHGVTITIDVDKAPNCLSCLLQDVNVRPTALAKKFCGDTGYFVLRAKPFLAHIFSEMYSVPERIRMGYLKVKILELLLFLSDLDPKEAEQNRSYTPAQVQLAKAASRYVIDHAEERITIEQLADRFAVSPTKLKASFKGVYGQPFYAYVRSQKMHAAGLMLRSTDCSILEVAGRYGYDNGSKFAKAFQEAVGMTPSQYRSATEQQLRELIEQ